MLYEVITTVAERTAEHAEAAARLAESEKALRAVLDALTEAALLMTPDGDILIANLTAARRLNNDAKSIVGSNLFDLMPPHVTTTRRERLAEVVATGRPVRFVDERDGHILDHSLQPVLNDQGEVTRVAAFSNDVTESRRAEEGLRRNEEFTRAISYNFV